MPRISTRRQRRVYWSAALVVLVLSAAGAVRAAEMQPESQPSPPAIPPIERVDGVDRALVYTQSEAIILDATRDYGSGLVESSTFILLRHAAAMPAGREQLDHAHAGDVVQLLTDPMRSRGQLFRFEVRLWRVLRQPALRDHRYWGERPVWRLDCTDSKTGAKMIFLLADLPEDLVEGEHVQGPRKTLAGIFFKNVRMEPERQGEDENIKRYYPVLVANAVFESGEAVGTGNSLLTGSRMLMFVVLIVLLGTYVFIKYRMRRPAAGAFRAYRPLRDENDVEGGGESPVDEELARQIEEHRRQRGKEADE